MTGLGWHSSVWPGTSRSSKIQDLICICTCYSRTPYHLQLPPDNTGTVLMYSVQTSPNPYAPQGKWAQPTRVLRGDWVQAPSVSGGRSRLGSFYSWDMNDTHSLTPTPTPTPTPHISSRMGSARRSAHQPYHLGSMPKPHPSPRERGHQDKDAKICGWQRRRVAVVGGGADATLVPFEGSARPQVGG